MRKGIVCARDFQQLTNKLPNLVGWASCPPWASGRARRPPHKQYGSVRVF
ncbi:hypothetical protein GXM_02025 [Nostoc sphaeroides CCNUC1]|uniref:Uncharacterized protein n=1 Tax=Nostoc sphaeroides CCNUC1 TaxID=2653204 RepID=A0A5P8VVZ5_9NOSO|nr:hypothetical protein GXM_02025 [Nostoc sphaeroides CCNUC1]